MESFVQDLRHAFRQLRKNPGFTTVAVATLALGIGVTAAVFSLANWALLRPIPGVRQPSDLVSVSLASQRQPGIPLSYADYRDLSRRLDATGGVAAETAEFVAIAAPGLAPARVHGGGVSANYFELLGVAVHLGRLLEPADLARGATPVVVLSHEFWSTAFSADSAVVGRTIQLNRVATLVVGIAAPKFAGMDRLAPENFWRPVTARAAVSVGGVDPYSHFFENRQSGLFSQLIARVPPGGSAERVEQEITSALAGVMRDSPFDTWHLRGARPVLRAESGSAGRNERIRSLLGVLWAAAAALVMLAVANVSNLFLLRGITRGNELAIRRALGATEARLARQHVLEALVIAVLASGAAGGVAAGLVHLFGSVELVSAFRVDSVRVDLRVIGFGALIGVVAGIGVSLVPVWTSTRTTPAAHGRSSGIGRGASTVVQLAACMTLLVGALLLAQSIRNLREVKVGFDPNGLSVLSLDLAAAGYDGGAAEAARAVAIAQVRAVPGVEGVARAAWSPFSGFAPAWTIYRRDGESLEDGLRIIPAWVDAEYFAVMGIRFAAGRSFSEAPAGDAAPAVREAIISRSTARWLFGDSDPLGLTFVSQGAPAPAAIVRGAVTGWANPRYRVVGVVPDTRWLGLKEQDFGPIFYRPLWDGGSLSASVGNTLVIRSSTEFDALKLVLERMVREVVPAAPLTVQSMADNIGLSISEERLLARVAGLLTLLAVSLAGIGLYSVVAFSVAQRTRELGIRMALGARVREVLDLVMRQGAMLAGLGLTVGAVGAAAVSQVLAGRLFGVTPLEPVVYLLAASLLMLLGLGGCVVPAWRATRVDPMVALRHD